MVYGEPAIVVGGRTGARARAQPSRTTHLRLGARSFDVPEAPIAGEPLAVTAFRRLLQSLNSPPVKVEATLDIPAGMGLGASAALAVAMARAVLACQKEVPEVAVPETECRELLTLAANAWENVFHGTASGVDSAAALRGGCLWFSKAGGAQPMSVKSLPRVLVAVADKSASTRTMVELVSERLRLHREDTRRHIRAMGALAREAKSLAEKGDWAAIGLLMNRNHELLAEVGVSTPSLDHARQVALEEGAHGAKLTGAGGGGCVVALSENSMAAQIIAAWRACGYQVVDFVV